MEDVNAILNTEQSILLYIGSPRLTTIIEPGINGPKLCQLLSKSSHDHDQFSDLFFGVDV